MQIKVYKITNPKGEIYVGQSKSLTRRMSNYKNHYCTNQPILCNSIKKYGWDNHRLEILAEVFTANDADELERMYIDHFKSNFKLYNQGLNCRDGGICNHTGSKKKVYEYDLNGVFIREWDSVTEAGTFYNSSPTHISQACSGKLKTSRKRRWSYEKLDMLLPYTRRISNKYKNIAQYDVKGNLIWVWPYVSNIVRSTGIQATNIIQAIKKNQQAHGFFWRLA